MILYADILFLIDFSMDVLTLWAVGRLTHSPMRAARLSAAAALSSAVTVAAVALGSSRIFSLALSAALSLVMCRIAFGRARAAPFIRRCVILWLGGLLLGGCMTALLQLGRLSPHSARDAGIDAATLMPAGALLAMLLTRTLSRTPRARFSSITLRQSGKSVTLRGLCDSGNLLTDPFTGEAVVIVKASAVRELFTEEEYTALISDGEPPSSLEGRLRLIPASGVSGEALLRALRLDGVYIRGTEFRALVALSEGLSVSDCDAVLPSSFS